jgi:peptidoglycan/LPS O-acetylase OafA/YrhL
MTDAISALAAAPRPGGAAPPIPAGRGHRNPGLDGLRVIAAFAVLLTHVGGQTGFEFTGTPMSWVANRGDIGVPIFFALSGLLLYRPWARAALDGEAGPGVGPYLLKRALRILPAYWLVVIVALITLNRPHLGSASTWAQYLLLGQSYNPHPWWLASGARGLGQMWSLTVEMTFYAVLPLLAAALDWLAWRGTTSVARRASRLLAGVGVLGLASFAFSTLEYYPSSQLWLGQTLPRLMTWFAAGMAIAIMAEWARAERDGGPASRFCAAIADSAVACWLIAILAFAIVCTPLAGPEALIPPSLWNIEIKLALYAVVAAALVAPVAFQPEGPTLVSRVLGNRAMRFLGQISYGIFLWQFVIIYGYFALVHARGGRDGLHYSGPGMVGVLVVCGLVTVAAATASYYLIERPAQHLYPPLRRSRQGQATPVDDPPGDALVAQRGL